MSDYDFKRTYNNFTVHLVCESDLSYDEALTLRRAVDHMAYKIGSLEFKKFCDSYRYSYQICSGMWWWKKCTTRIIHNFKKPNGRTSSEVYEHIIQANETLRNTKNGTADITLVVDRRNRRGVLGYTYPNSTKQWIYSWFLKSDYKRVAGNLAHEWCHKLGYDHAFRYNGTRRHTVPYAVGDFVAEIVR